jgi:hypothetical protein
MNCLITKLNANVDANLPRLGVLVMEFTTPADGWKFGDISLYGDDPANVPIVKEIGGQKKLGTAQGTYDKTELPANASIWFEQGYHKIEIYSKYHVAASYGWFNGDLLVNTPPHSFKGMVELRSTNHIALQGELMDFELSNEMENFQTWYLRGNIDELLDKWSIGRTNTMTLNMRFAGTEDYAHSVRYPNAVANTNYTVSFNNGSWSIASLE